MKVSVITWDANFRENLHTIDSFSTQNFDQNEYELIWVDFYGSNPHVRDKINEYDNCRLLTLNNSSDISWHLGKCINEGVKSSSGDVLIIPDGDVLVDSDFIANVFQFHKDKPELLSYHRRYDEPEKPELQDEVLNIANVAKRTKLLNPLNYAGCLVLSQSLFSSLEGYEEHEIFSGPGMNAYEFYVRARNSGASIRWGRDKIYHPWHESTGLSSVQHRERMLLKTAMIHHPWLNPYSGIGQSWVVRCREMNIDISANASVVNDYLAIIPAINIENLVTLDDLIKENRTLTLENKELEDIALNHECDNFLVSIARRFLDIFSFK